MAKAAAWFVFMMSLCCSLFSSAQPTTFGTVGNQVIDQQLIYIIQLFDPSFALNPNKEAFTKQLFKSYVLTKEYADKAKAAKLTDNETVKKNLELVKKLAEDHYLALLMMRTETDSLIPVSDKEAMAYYNTHVPMFTNPAQFTYLVAYINDTVAHPIAEVKKQIKQYAPIITDEFKMGDGQAYNIVFNKRRTLPLFSNDYRILNALPEGEFSSTVTEGKQKTVFYLISKIKESTKSFEEVKETCKANIGNEKREQAKKEFDQKALQDYPIQLSSDFFK